ncbi:MAG: hypothetical protein K2G40_00185 [Muribaculaceae bacterium]|nr:hypothetical protein [Muribaculaceae bacterium]
MATDSQKLVKSLKEKHGVLIKRYLEAAAARDKALQRVADLEYTTRQQARELEQLRLQVEYLTVVSTISPSTDEIEKSKVLLSGLVREIDKCINDLTE